jgi:hypothetical protein
VKANRPLMWSPVEAVISSMPRPARKRPVGPGGDPAVEAGE